jgi:glycosyltransferase involved in cell wall biosynthesis
VKITHVYKDYYPPVRGGIEQTIELAARSQAALGHEVTVLVSASGGRRTTTETIAGVRVVRVAEWGRAMSSPLCPGFPARPRGALVVTYHSDVVRQRMVMPVYGPFVRALLRRADVVLPTSDRYVDFSPFLREVRERCRVVPSGIDLSALAGIDRDSEAAVRLRERYGGPFVLFVGRMRYYKGLDVLLRAMTLVRGRAVIVGDGPMRDALHALHAELGLGDRVRFAGSISDDDLRTHLAAAAVGVLPSTHPSEALGLAQIEYLAAGLPSVCTELGTGTSFVNRDGETGFVVTPGDPAELAAALSRLLEDEALSRRMGDAGRARAQEVFSSDAMVRGYQAAYEEAIRIHARRAGV